MPVSVDPAANIHPIDVDLFMDMEAAGHLQDRRVELVDGLLIEMGPQSTEHVWASSMLGRYFVGGLINEPEYVVALPGSLVASRYSVPEPDLTVYLVDHLRVPPRPGGRLSPPPSACLLTAEAAITSLRWDLGRKRRLYAEADVPEYWVVDVTGERLVVHRDPVDGDYRAVSEHRRGEPVAPEGLPLPSFDVATALDRPA